MTFGKCLKDWRKHFELTQAEIAEVIDVTAAAVCYWEGGKNPSHVHTMAVIGVFKVSPSVFWGGPPKGQPKRRLSKTRPS